MILALCAEARPGRTICPTDVAQVYAAAAMIGSAFILADPIFLVLTISLVFGPASSTALTPLVIPAIYV